MVTQVPDRLVACALIVAWGCGGRAPATPSGVSGSGLVAHRGQALEKAYDTSTGISCVPNGSPQVPSRARGPRVPTVNHLHPNATWSLPDSSRIFFFEAPPAPRGDVFPGIDQRYVRVGTMNRCETLFAGQLVQYDTWRYKQQTSNDTMYVARLILTSGPRQGLEVLAFSHGEAARAAMFELLGNLTLEDQ